MVSEYAMPKLYVGSIKTVIGHTEGTAGIASLLKASLALRNRTIPPNLLLDKLNPKIERFYSNLQIQQEAIPWPSVSEGQTRRASVNSFGFGGTNAHAILEEYVADNAPATSRSVGHNILPLVFSATSEQSLMDMITSYADFVPTLSQSQLADVAYTLATRRSVFPTKMTFSARSSEALAAKLRSFVGNGDSASFYQDSSRTTASKRLLGIFTGQGAQWPAMGRELLLSYPGVQVTVHKLENALNRLPESDRPLWSLRGQLLAGKATSKVRTAEVSQPLCTAVQAILVDLLHAAGVSFDAVIGHSSGEIGAAYAAGLLSAEDAVCIAYYRGFHSTAARGQSGEPGRMMAVGTSVEDATSLCQDFDGKITVAAVNSSNSITISGDESAIKEAKGVLDDEKKFARILAVDRAYHSSHMLTCGDAYLESLRKLNIRIKTPTKTCKWYSSVRDAQMDSSCSEIADQYWVDNMVKPVLYAQALECALGGIDNPTLAIEVGPHPALKGPSVQVVQELLEQPLPYSATLKRGVDDIEAIGETLGELWQRVPGSESGFKDVHSFVTDGGTCKLTTGLPSYVWNHNRTYWHESRLSHVSKTRSTGANELLGQRVADDPENQFRWRNILSPREIPYLTGHQIQGQIVFPAAGYISAAVEAARQAAKNDNIQLIEVEDIHIGQALVFEEQQSTVESLVTLTGLHHQEHILTADYSFYSAAARDSSTLTLNAGGKLRIRFGPGRTDVLPAKSPESTGMIEVDPDRFYHILSGLGYGYERSFRALSALNRKRGEVTGTVKKPLQEDETTLTVHPATLDAAIQSIMLAMSWPGDGRLWTLHVPTHVARIAVNPLVLDEAVRTDGDLRFHAHSIDKARSGIIGDIAIFASSKEQRAITMEGIQAVPLEMPSADSDRLLFSSIHWGLARPDAEVVAYDGKASKQDYELAYILERVAHFYLRHINQDFAPDDPAREESAYAGLLNYASHIVQLVGSGTHKYAQVHWTEDTEEIIQLESSKYPNNVDLEIMHIIGRNMTDVIRGKSAILEHLRPNDLLDRYYVDAMGISYYTNYLARVLGQLAHRHPHMHIIEIGKWSTSPPCYCCSNAFTRCGHWRCYKAHHEGGWHLFRYVHLHRYLQWIL